MNLTLFFTEHVALKTWEDVGMLDREIALYKKLQAHGIDIQFVTYGGREEKRIAKKLDGISVRANTLNLPTKAYKWSLINNPPRGDIFKSNQVLGAETAAASAKKAGAKFIARAGYLPSLMDAARYGESSSLAAEKRKIEKSVFRSADYVVLTAEFMASTVVKRYDLDPKRVRVIPNYVETERFSPAHTGSQRFRVGTVGRLDYQKNILTLIDALASLDIDLDIVGGGPLESALKDRARSSNANIRFLGNLPNPALPAFLNALDLFVLPSFYEGHPKALLEAMACGIAVLGARVQGVEGLIRDEQNGLLCDTDSASIRAAVERLVANRDLREALGAAGRSFVEKEFSIDRITNLELNLLNEAVAQ